MNRKDTALSEFRRTIGGIPVIVRCSADLDQQADQLLDVIVREHKRGMALEGEAFVEFGGIPFILRHTDGAIIVHEPDLKAPGHAVPEAEYVLRILYEQDALARRVGAERSIAPLRAIVRVQRGSMRSPHVSLRREPPSEPRDSGWRIGAAGKAPAHSNDDLLETVVAEILRTRPWLGRVLGLPAGYRVVVNVPTIESIETEAGERVWHADLHTLGRRARKALNEQRIAELERLTNGLLESVTTDGEQHRAIRRLGREWGGGWWVAYANGLTALAIRRWRLANVREVDDDDVAEIDSFLQDFRSALSRGGKLAGEVAPFVITKYVTTLSRDGMWDAAAELLEGLLAPESVQQATLLFQRAVIAYRNNERMAAIDALRSSVKLQPGSAHTWFFLGKLLREEMFEEVSPAAFAQSSELLEAFDRALALLDARDTLDIDRCIHAVGDWNLNGDWRLVDLFRERTLVLMALGRLDESLNSAERMTTTAPHEPDGWELLGRISLKLGRLEAAIHAYGEAIERWTSAPTDSLTTDHKMFVQHLGRVWYERAAARALLGQRDWALADLRQALTVAPSWAKAVSFDTRFRELAADPELQRLVDEVRVHLQDY